MRTLLLNPYSHAKVKTTNYPSPSLLQLLLHIPSKSLQNQIHKPTTTSSSFFFIYAWKKYTAAVFGDSRPKEQAAEPFSVAASEDPTASEIGEAAGTFEAYWDLEALLFGPDALE